MLAAGAALAQPAATQRAEPTAPLFRMDCGHDGSLFPLCGFEHRYDRHEGRVYTRTRVPAGSPSGRDSVRFDFIATDAQGQFEYGWFNTPDEAVPQGATRYLRYRVKIIAPMDWRSNRSKSMGGKLAILGNLCERPPFQPTRVIGNIEPSGSRTLRWVTEQNIGGSPSRLDVSKSLTPDWHHVQIKVVSSSTREKADGMLYQYVDEDNRDEKRPTAESSGGFLLLTAGWSSAEGCRDSQLVFGGTTGGTLAKGAHAAFELADFEYDDRFDPAWHRPQPDPKRP